jgi:hypothetical protein
MGGTKKGKEQSIEATDYIGHGTGRFLLRAALPDSHPESWPSLWKAKYGSLAGFPWKKLNREGPRCPHCGQEYHQDA